MKNQIENPKGLHARYSIRKIKVVKNPDFGKDLSNTLYGKRRNTTSEFKIITEPTEENSEYFVLKMDENADDIEHLKACRIAVNSYANSIEHHLPQLAKDIREKWPILAK